MRDTDPKYTGKRLKEIGWLFGIGKMV